MFIGFPHNNPTVVKNRQASYSENFALLRESSYTNHCSLDVRVEQTKREFRTLS
ncbi:hypothetical protein [Virgibacillus sp. Bac332]|uniref:hypothetical protein n=1 Tax=Virgibacillus sp. Bac332 TaxID=2419842 RepID=UPI0013CE8EEB|nr:hypothetical protein [Virgibacillus sp. Bac332]